MSPAALAAMLDAAVALSPSPRASRRRRLPARRASASVPHGGGGRGREGGKKRGGRKESDPLLWVALAAPARATSVLLALSVSPVRPGRVLLPWFLRVSPVALPPLLCFFSSSVISFRPWSAQMAEAAREGKKEGPSETGERKQEHNRGRILRRDKDSQNFIQVFATQFVPQ